MQFNHLIITCFIWVGSVVFACQQQHSANRPALNDFVFYRYEVYQGDSLVYTAVKEPGDTAQTFVEDPALHIGNDLQVALMKQLPQLSPGDSIVFDLGNNRQGRLHLLHFIRRADYPKYIEEGNKRRAIFEERLEVIKAEMNNQEPFYRARAQAVADSAVYYAKLLREGILDDQMKTFAPGISYVLLKKGSGATANKRSSWTWIHFCGLTPDGQILLNTYEVKPVVVNRRGALLAPWVEKSVVQFPEGSQVLLKVPYSMAFGEESNVPVPVGSDLIVLMEIIRANNM